MILVTGDDAANAGCREFTSVAPCDGSEVGNFRLLDCCYRAISDAVCTMAGGAVIAENLRSIQGYQSALIMGRRLWLTLAGSDLRVTEPKQSSTAQRKAEDRGIGVRALAQVTLQDQFS